MTNKEAKEIMSLYKQRLDESCSNLLERDKEAFSIAIEALDNIDELCENLAFYINERNRLLEKRSTGEWIIGQTMDCHSDIINTYTCPFCGVKEYRAYPFCHCGADMRGERR